MKLDGPGHNMLSFEQRDVWHSLDLFETEMVQGE